MALAPLAVAADLAGRGVDVTDTQRVTTALDVASSTIRDAAGSAISQQTSTLTFPATSGTFLRLPGPVTAITAVTMAGTSVTSYELDDGGITLCGGWSRGPIVISLTYGLPEVPADIVDLTCNLAKAWLDHVTEGGGSTAGLKSVRLDDAAEAYTDESAGQVSPVYIPDVTRTWLAARFGGGATVVGTR